MAFETLNRLKWKGELPGCEVVILHRGAEDDRKLIHGTDITAVKRSYITCRHEKGESFIPLHRVLEIRHGGKVLWKRRTARSTGE